MKVDIEFFSCEPVDNLIACLNYKVDKIIIFGYEKDMSASICRNICQVINQKLKLKEIDFVTVNQFELKDILYKMDHVIKAELDAGNECYIDINGGRDLLLVAAGIIADKYGLYMQHIDIKSGENHIYDMCVEGEKEFLAQRKNCRLNISEFIKLKGGCINEDYIPSYKSAVDDPYFCVDVKKLWLVRERFSQLWNDFCMILANHRKYTYGNVLELQLNAFRREFRERDNYYKFLNFIKDLYNNDIVYNLHWDERRIKFKYKSTDMKDFLCDPGGILELYAYIMAKDSEKYDDAAVGVHLDWDGVIHPYGTSKDIVNEIDVILMKDNIPIFISCKNGNVSNTDLYELDTVTSRFGGIYARKVLLISKNIKDITRLRAEEMNIEIVKINR